MPRVMCAAIIHEAEEVVKFTNGERLNLGERYPCAVREVPRGNSFIQKPSDITTAGRKVNINTMEGEKAEVYDSSRPLDHA